MANTAIQKLYESRMIRIFGLMLLFFMIFDGIMTYILPLAILEDGLSKTQLGIIMGVAAISGALFDLAIYRIFKDVVYRRLFIIMFFVGFVYIFTVWMSNSFTIYLVAMIMWGFYFDLKNFGTLDLVSRHSRKDGLSSNFGVVQAFQSVGYIIAPLIAGSLIIDKVGWKPFAASLVSIAIAGLLFIWLLYNSRKSKQVLARVENEPAKKLSQELKIWKQVGSALLPVLFLGAFATVFDSFFVAIGPVFAENLPIEPLDGFFMAAYFFPPVIMGPWMGRIAKRLGEKTAALSGLLLGSVALCALSLTSNPFLMIGIVFVSSCFTCWMMPMAQGIYASFIQKAPKFKKEVQELADFFQNGGYIVGLFGAGFIADKLGDKAVFITIGLAGIVVAGILALMMAKRFSVTKR